MEDNEVLPESSDNSDREDDKINMTDAVNNENVDDPGENINYHNELPFSIYEVRRIRKNEEKSSKRLRNDIDIMNDNDDIIAELIGDMKHVAECDWKLFNEGKLAINKITILPKCLS